MNLLKVDEIDSRTSGKKDNVNVHHNVNIQRIIPMIPPACLLEEIPITEKAIKTVRNARFQISEILKGNDDRLLLVCGPCSIHEINSALEYAKNLYELSKKVSEDILIVMRTYFEKPRTTVGWKGLINDPYLNDTCKINHGMSMARKLLLDISDMGLPCGYECLDTITPQYIADVMSWAAIGARTTESQVHRQLSSGLSMPVGFKNGTKGSIEIAANAIISARHSHCFLGVTQQGLVAIIKTSGNKDTHIILRGGKDGPNYTEPYIKQTEEILRKSKLEPKIMVDCSHGNSGKDYRNQPKVCRNVCKQIRNGNFSLMGMMMESNINEGSQKLVFGKCDTLEYGKSITDSCMSFETTEEIVLELAEAVRFRRLHFGSKL
tara:strand:- start:6023 stop:7156 length:1134 start_codon:yes stop_codon:yes gene_type:complete